MKEKTQEKVSVWLMLFLLIPVLSLTKLNRSFSNISINPTLLSGLLGIVGGLIGFGIFNLVKTKTTVLKIFALAFLLAICIAILMITKK